MMEPNTISDLDISFFLFSGLFLEEEKLISFFPLTILENGLITAEF